jgi:hypothetical protein
MKWYLNKTGKEWREEESMTPDFSGLSAKDADVGALLYSRYLREKEEVDQYAYSDMQSRLATEQNKRKIWLSTGAAKRYLGETALAKGQQGTDYAAKRAQAIDENSGALLANEDAKRQKVRERLLGAYASERDKADMQLQKDIEDTERQYQSLWRSNWATLHSQLNDALPNYKSKYVGGKYRSEVVDVFKQRIEEQRQDLGDYYEEAIEWVNNLPIYRGRTDGEMLMVGNQKVFVSDKVLNNADIVHYRKGAGVKVTKLDTFSVGYRGQTYYVRAGNAVDGDTGKLLNAIADYRRMVRTTGTIIYYNGDIYVYDGVSRWMSTDNIVGLTETHCLSNLLKDIQKDLKN